MAVAQHMKDAQLYESSPAVDPETGYVTYPASVSWPRHKRYVDIDVDLGMVSSHQGDGVVRVSGASLTHSTCRKMLITEVEEKCSFFDSCEDRCVYCDILKHSLINSFFLLHSFM